jgi:hypothetical protein
MILFENKLFIHNADNQKRLHTEQKTTRNYCDVSQRGFLIRVEHHFREIIL